MKAVSPPQSSWTIVQDISIYAAYPRLAISDEVTALFGVAKQFFSSKLKQDARGVQTLLECYLQITSQRLDKKALLGPSLSTIGRGFIGALESESFISCSTRTRYNFRNAFSRLIVAVTKSSAGAYVPEVPNSSRFLSLKVGECIKAYRQTKLREDRVRIWRGWRLDNLNGATRWLRLEPLSRRFDSDFVESFYKVCEIYFSTGRDEQIEHLNILAEFITNYPNATPNSFLDEGFATGFWHEFYVHFVRIELETCSVSTIVNRWFGLVKRFSEEHLFPSGLFAKPEVFPMPPRRKIIGHQAHLNTNSEGRIQIEKLLTYVPIHLSHREAIEILFSRLNRDVNFIMAWANAEASKIWAAYENRLLIEEVGATRMLQQPGANTKMKWLTDRGNPEYLQNAAATLLNYGGYTTQEASPGLRNILSDGMKKLACELGFPTSGTLLPHMTILVHEHPEITPSFLEKLFLLDSNGKYEGFIEDDSGYVLKGVKMRRGSTLAEQHIKLTARAADIVKQVIAITEAPRRYLKEKNDPNYRYMFLTTGAGFGIPRPVTNIALCTSDKCRTAALALQVQKHNNLDEMEAIDLVARFSLPALRASMGVIEYVRTCSGPKMAAKLGHAKYHPKLLSRYLPPAIKSFLQSRYIRIMQTGIIVEAMKGSPHLLKAASFSVVVNKDVASSHAAFLNSSGGFRSGFSQTSSFNSQSRVVPVQRSGWRCFAAS